MIEYSPWPSIISIILELFKIENIIIGIDRSLAKVIAVESITFIPFLRTSLNEILSNFVAFMFFSGSSSQSNAVCP